MKQLWWLLFACACVDNPEVSETTSSISILVLEAEDSIGAGSVELDATASNGALRAMASPGTHADQAFATAGAISSGSVRVRGGSCAPHVRVDIDGITVVPTQPVASATWTTIAFAGPIAAGDHVLRLHYRNGTRGCVLRFDEVTLTVEDPPPPPPPVVVEAETAGGYGTVVGDPSASGGAYLAFGAPYQRALTSFTTTVATTGAVAVRAVGCADMPFAKVTIDGVVAVLTQVPTSGSWVSLPLGTWSSGNHSLSFEYRYGEPGCVMHFDHATFTP